jgi:hypothetical protein
MLFVSNQVNRFVVAVIVIVFIMMDNRLVNFYRLKKEIKIISFWHQQLRYVTASQAKVIKNIMPELV